MIIVYTPAGGEPERYDAQSLRVSEASIVQRAIDQKWHEIREGLADEDLDAMRAIVWVIKKRSNPSLTLADVDPGVGELVTRLDKAEVAAYIEQAYRIRGADPDVTHEEIAAALAGFPAAADDPDHAARLIEEAAAKDPAPKASVKSAGRPRSTTSKPTDSTT